MGSLDLYGYKNSGQYLETDFEGDGFSSRIRLTITFKPDKNTSIQLQGSYRDAENSVVNDRNAVYVLNAGASRTILKGDGTLAFNIQAEPENLPITDRIIRNIPSCSLRRNSLRFPSLTASSKGKRWISQNVKKMRTATLEAKTKVQCNLYQNFF